MESSNLIAARQYAAFHLHGPEAIPAMGVIPRWFSQRYHSCCRCLYEGECMGKNEGESGKRGGNCCIIPSSYFPLLCDVRWVIRHRQTSSASGLFWRTQTRSERKKEKDKHFCGHKRVWKARDRKDEGIPNWG
jgi:hypothetical protein